jgi:hypothetical protein
VRRFDNCFSFFRLAAFGAQPTSRKPRTESYSSGKRSVVPREGIIRNHRHDEPLFVLSMVA